MNKPKLAIIFFKAKNNEWCVRFVAKNGKQLMRASETYKSRYTLNRIVQRMIALIGAGEYQFTVQITKKG
jgi:uncharacterized protein YegP (UPF0339 family)